MENVTMMRRLITLLTFALLTFGAAAQTVPDTLLFVFKLHGQTRRFEMSFEQRQDSIRLTWGIERKLKWLSGTYTMTPKRHVVMPAAETVYLIGRKAYRTLKATGRMAYNQTNYRLLDTDREALGRPLLHVRDEAEGEEMWILDNPALPLVWQMKNNPLEINWTVQTME